MPPSETPPPAPRPVLDAPAIERALRRMALEIVEHHAAVDDLPRLALVGIQTRGVEVARRLTAYVGEILQTTTGDGFSRPAFGALDISMHRDDLRRRAPATLITSVQTTDLPLDLDDRAVVLTDDVFYTGRTARAALDALNTFGRPRRVSLAILVDRGGRQLPIRPDFVGRKLFTSSAERVRVRFQTLDGVGDGVWIVAG